MADIEALLTNTAYGYPRGSIRRVTPFVIAVLHQTANAGATAKNERDYANRAGSLGPSATYYIDTAGVAVHAVDGTRYAAWGSGDVKNPRTSIATVARIVAERAKGTNANECVWEQLEVCGAGAEPYNDAQFETVARLVATRAHASGLPIDRTTVLVHADLNTVDRPSDPWPAATREARVARVIARARELAGGSDVSLGIVTITRRFGDPAPGRQVSIPPGTVGLAGYDPARPGAAVIPPHDWPNGSGMNADYECDVAWPGQARPPVPTGAGFVHITNGVYAGTLVVKAQVRVAEDPPPPPAPIDTTPYDDAEVERRVAERLVTATAEAVAADRAKAKITWG